MIEMISTSPHTWIDWYRFARRVLRLGHVEAAEYATVRHVEDENRRVQETGRRAA